MSISCDCEFDGGIRSVGDAREVTCRTPRECDNCGLGISSGDTMYIQSMYDWDEMLATHPVYSCEECGDMAENLMYYGYCFQYCKVWVALFKDGNEVNRYNVTYIESIEWEEVGEYSLIPP